jgi:hypothetical protein
MSAALLLLLLRCWSDGGSSSSSSANNARCAAHTYAHYEPRAYLSQCGCTLDTRGDAGMKKASERCCKEART